MIRFRKTLKFIEKHVSKDKQIVDLGSKNALSDLMQGKGYSVNNTGIVDLDIDYELKDKDYGVITAFEIFEHLFAPFNLLNNNSGVLVASVPLKVWFASSYWNKKDKWDCHYHEFEIKQFNALLDRTGWEIVDSEVWRSPDKLRFGIRPLLRFIFPSYYIVIAKKTKEAI